MDKNKNVFFLGAWFSKEAALPIMRDFAPYSERQLESLKRKHGKNAPPHGIRNSAPLLIESGELYEAFRKHLNTISKNNSTAFSANNMEDLFTIAEMMMNYNQYETLMTIPSYSREVSKFVTSSCLKEINNV